MFFSSISLASNVRMHSSSYCGINANYFACSTHPYTTTIHLEGRCGSSYLQCLIFYHQSNTASSIGNKRSLNLSFADPMSKTLCCCDCRSQIANVGLLPNSVVSERLEIDHWSEAKYCAEDIPRSISILIKIPTPQS